MLQALLCLACAIGPDAEQPALVPSPASLASATSPASHYWGEREVSLEDSIELPAPSAEALAISREGVPPSPPILNGRGWRSVTAIMCDYPAVVKDSTPDPTDLSPVTEEVAEILAKWESASRETKTLKLTFNQLIYLFDSDTHADGELYCHIPTDVRLVVGPPRAGRPARGRVPGLEPLRAEQWIWSPNRLLLVHDDDRSFARFQRLDHEASPPEIGGLTTSYCSELFEQQQTSSWISIVFRGMLGPTHPDIRFPFLLSINAENLRSLWSFELKKRDGGKIFLVATPRTRLFRQYYSECWIALDTATWRTTAIKTIDPTRNLRVVYSISDRMVNRELPADTFEPDLESKGYRDSLGNRPDRLKK